MIAGDHNADPAGGFIAECTVKVCSSCTCSYWHSTAGCSLLYVLVMEIELRFWICWPCNYTLSTLQHNPCASVRVVSCVHAPVLAWPLLQMATHTSTPSCSCWTAPTSRQHSPPSAREAGRRATGTRMTSKLQWQQCAGAGFANQIQKASEPALKRLHLIQVEVESTCSHSGVSPCAMLVVAALTPAAVYRNSYVCHSARGVSRSRGVSRLCCREHGHVACALMLVTL